MDDDDIKKSADIEDDSGRFEAPDFKKQINHVRSVIEKKAADIHRYTAPFVDAEGRRAFIKHIDMGPRRGGRASIVPSDECAVELGPPGTANANMVLWTEDESIIRDGEINVLGSDMRGGEKLSLPYAQVVMLAVENLDEADPFTFESTQFLSNRLKGFMVRTVPGRLWARVSFDAVKDGMDFARLGGALIAVYREDFEYVKAAEVFFITDREDEINELHSVAAEARILLGKNKKLVLVGDGEYECTDLDCEDCDEKETCDAVRDIVVLRRKSRDAES